MILVTHGVVGGALAKMLFGFNPFVAFVFGFFSHFVMDMIPHWDYHISAEKKSGSLDNNFDISRKHLGAITKIGLDFLAGMILPILFFSFSWVVVLGALGGIMPDILQFVYWKTKHPLFLQKFHHWIHARHHYNGRPLLGASMQTGIIGLVFYLTNLIR